MKTDSRCHVKGFSGSRRCGAEALDTGSYFLLCNPKGFSLAGGGVAAGWFGAGQGEWTRSAV